MWFLCKSRPIQQSLPNHARGRTLPMVKICEGQASVWHYHLCWEHGDSLTAICGAKTMPCSAPLESWGHKPKHMRSSYCKECERLANDNHLLDNWS